MTNHLEFIWKPSPNYAPGVDRKVVYIVLHNTVSTAASAIATFQNPDAQVSIHNLVDRDATVYQLVDYANIAWHAGNRAINASSIGIEIVAYPAALGMTPEQGAAVVALVKSLMAKYAISIENVIPHRRVRATACPSLIWPTEQSFEEWKKKELA